MLEYVGRNVNEIEDSCGSSGQTPRDSHRVERTGLFASNLVYLVGPEQYVQQITVAPIAEGLQATEAVSFPFQVRSIFKVRFLFPVLESAAKLIPYKAYVRAITLTRSPCN